MESERGANTRYNWPMAKYFGKYADFQTASKADAGVLLGADNAVGDVCDIVIELEDGAHKAWMQNQFGQRICYFDADFSRRLSLLAADGLVEKAVLSFVAFTDHPGEGRYWGQAAVICYSPAYAKEFDKFVANVAGKIGADIRPRVDFDAEAVEKIIDSGGEWMPSQNVVLPDNQKGMAFIKRRRRMTDKLIDQGRAGNKGCYVASWAVILALVALLVFGLKSCFGW